MDAISQKDIDRICEFLKTWSPRENGIQTNEANELAEKLQKAEIIPKLYTAAYIQAMKIRLENIKTYEELADADENNKLDFGDTDTVFFTMQDKRYSKIDVVKNLLNKAIERQNDICDFDDTPLPHTKKGRCEGIEDFDHYDNIEIDALLTKDEYEQFINIRDTKGWQEACKAFEDKLNPDGQDLKLLLNSGSDETKMSRANGSYVCPKCYEYITDNAEGTVSCDVDIASDG